ncbi:MAG: hypothetical protein EPO32_01345 [Anaerolineae bacterium]|nr:MAG: hypothetical protein EPO32_01345 [Anaerolineae bacterium]
MNRPKPVLILGLACLLAACTAPTPEPTPTLPPPTAVPAPSATPAPLPGMTFEDLESDMVDCVALLGAQDPQGDLVTARAALEADHLYLEANTAAPLESLYGFTIQVQVYSGSDEGVFSWDVRESVVQSGEVGLADGGLLDLQPIGFEMTFEPAEGQLVLRLPFERLQPPYAFVLLRTYFSSRAGRPQLCDTLDLIGIHTLTP